MVYVRSTPIAICDCEGKVRAIALRLRLRLRPAHRTGNATASLKSAYVYYVYDHQRHLLTTTSLQIGIFPQLLCYSVYSKGAVLHFVYCMRVICSSHKRNVSIKQRRQLGLRAKAGVKLKMDPPKKVPPGGPLTGEKLTGGGGGGFNG